MTASNNIKQNYKEIIQSIDIYQKKYNQTAHDVKLLAVSKTKTPEDIMELIKLGQTDFGENYLQEAINKINNINKLNLSSPINWHYIGQIQSNKTKEIALNFSWVHSVDRFKIAKRLSEQRDPKMKKVNILIQVNLQNDTDKAGVPPEELLTLAKQIDQLENSNLKLRGLMCMLKLEENTKFDTQYNCFKKLFELYNDLNTNYNFNLDTLSMGMSNDFKAAIAAGSTIIRIGSALFGKRFA